MRPLWIMVAVLLGAVAGPAWAKDGVRATLAAPAEVARAQPGARVRVAFRLTDSRGERFGASGLYLRLRAFDGDVVDVPAVEAGGGRLAADVTIPAGGIASMTVGLQGMRFATGQPPARADASFPVANFDAARPPARTDGPPWTVLLAAAAVVVAVAVGRRLASRRLGV